MTERRLLQIVVAIGSLVPISAGLAGILLGLAMVEVTAAPAAADSHFSYLSGLLLGIGIAFMTAIPGIERHTGRVRLLTAIVVAGGLGRLVALVMRGYPGTPMLFALIMELAVTPALCLWQGRVAAQAWG